MPELPEMETYRTLLARTVLSQTITQPEVNREKTINVGMGEFAERVKRQRIVAIERRAKQLLFRLESGDVLLLHLMLGGWMTYGPRADVPEHQSQVVLPFESGDVLHFHGLRLGYLHLYATEAVEAKLSDLGPDPLWPTFTAHTLQQALRHKRGPVKFGLVDQHIIAGIGNCYSDEACFEAGLLPLKPIPDVGDDLLAKLHAALRTTLQRAIAAGGYMDRPYMKGDTLTGGYNDKCLVYDRPGEPCPRCGHPITLTHHNKRKVFYCENCQH